MNTNQLIEELLLDVSVYHPIPDFRNPEHIDTLLTICEQKGYSQLIPTLKEVFLNEAPAQTAAQKMGLVHLGRGYYGKKAGGPATHRSEDGKIVPLKPQNTDGGRLAIDKAIDQAKEQDKDVAADPYQSILQGKTGEQPGEKEKEKSPEEKEHDSAINTPQKVLNDPKASARSIAVARAQQTKNNVASTGEEDTANETGERNHPEGFDPIDPADVVEEMPDAKSDTFVSKSELPNMVGTETLEQFNTDIDRLAKVIADAKQKGGTIPNVNLCQVSIPGTNLYCDDNLGIPREEMPQFKGKPIEGSTASKMPLDQSGEVDTEPVFKEMLKRKGIKTLQTEIPADKLKATQSELVGAKVLGMMGALEKDPNHPAITAPIYVSRDGYVVDGHHRWAAVVAYNAKHPDAQIPMRVTVIDDDIKNVIPMANKFAEDIGIAAKKADANKETPTAKPKEAQPEPKYPQTDVPKAETPAPPAPKILSKEPKSQIDRENDSYGKGKAGENKPKEEPNVTDDEVGAKAKTNSGKTLYHIGGGYYSDSPNGVAKYIRVESIIERAIATGSKNWWNLLFEADIKASVKDGGEGTFREIPKGDQDAATLAAKSAGSTLTQKVPTPNSIKDAIFTHSKQKDAEKKQKLIDGKLAQSGAQLSKASEKSSEAAKKRGIKTKKGFIYLETEPGSGKFKEFKVRDVHTSLGKLLTGEKLLKNDIENLNGVVKLVTNPDNGDVKIYFAEKFVGKHPQQGYESVEIAKENVAMGDSIRAFAKTKGLNVGKSSEGAIGKKVLTPTKFGSSINPDNPTNTIQIQKTESGAVSIGSNEIKKLKEPNEDKLIQKLISKGLGEEEAKKRAKMIVLQTKAYNQRLDDLLLAAERTTPPGNIPMVNFGDVSNSDSRKKTINTIVDGVIKRFESELDKFAETFGKSDLKLKPENKKIFETLQVIKKLNESNNLQTDEKTRTEYKSQLDQLLLDMANSSDFKDSVADFAEIKVGLQLLAEGKQVYFPASENFQTADLIVMPDQSNFTPKEGQTIEDVIAENLQFYAVTVEYVGGLSVKYKGGGGSANYSKIEQSEYKNSETKDILIGIQGIYNLAYPKDKSQQNNIPSAAIQASKKKLNDAMQYAIQKGLMTKEEAKLILEIGKGQANNTLGGALKDVAKCKGANRKNFEEAVLLHHTMLHLTAVINNRDVAYTRFSNFNEEIREDKEGNAVNVIDDVADGVSKPCYMNPHHNPGFSISEDVNTGCKNGAPSNQNPSHIESEMPKNLLKSKSEKASTSKSNPAKKKGIKEMLHRLPNHLKEKIATRLKETLRK